MHHGDGGYDVHDPALTPQQRALVEFPESWFNRPTQPKNPGRATADLYANNAMTRLHTAAGAWTGAPLIPRGGIGAPRSALLVRAPRL